MTITPPRAWLDLPIEQKNRFEQQARYLIEKGYISTTKTIEEVAISIFKKIGPKDPYTPYDPFKDFPHSEE